MIKKQKIEKLNHQGYGIIRLNNKVIFVPYTLEKDVVDIEIINNYKKYALAEVVDYIIKDKNHREVICPYYTLCGGCQISHMNYKKQLDFKKEKVTDIFKRYLNIDIEPEIIYDKEFYYRNKVVFHVENGEIGYYKENTNDLINIKGCRILDKKINEILPLIRKLDLTNIEKIMIRTTTKEMMVVFYGYIDKIDILKDKVDSIILINIKEKLLHGKSYIKEEINDLKFIISHDSFFQVNTNITKKMYDKILNYSSANSNDKVLDLYCGTGTIGLYLSKNINSVTGIEIVENAVNDANINKEINNITNATFISGDVSKILDETYKEDILIVDPPRSGLNEKTRKMILENNYKKIIYTSCDPMTLVRDLKDLMIKYDLVDITLFDMFPNTYHVECCALLKLKESTEI